MSSCSLYCQTGWGMGQVDKIVGASAPEDTLEALEALASAHHAQVRQRPCCAWGGSSLACMSADACGTVRPSSGLPVGERAFRNPRSGNPDALRPA